MIPLMVLPIIILAALLWTLSSMSLSRSEQLLKSMFPYSREGLMKDSYIISSVFLSRVCFRCVITFSFLCAEVVMLSIWSFHVSLVFSVTPRCLCKLVSSRMCPSNRSGGGFISFLRDMYRLFVFWGLNETNHLFAHSLIIPKSRLSWFVASTGLLSTVIKSDVSSANSFIPDWIFSVMSLMWIRNKSGPKLEPCGMPASMFL